MNGKRVSSNRTARRPSPGVTLIELLIVVTILGVLVSMVLVGYQTSVPDQLYAAANVVVSDVSYCRSLAVANNSRYKLTFAPKDNCYWLAHSGSTSALNNLPDSPFRSANDPRNRQTTDFDNLPSGLGQIELLGVRRVASTTESNTTQIEFNELGALTQTEQAVIWLSAGSGDAKRYITVRVNPVTGIAEVGDIQVAAPTSL